MAAILQDGHKVAFVSLQNNPQIPFCRVIESNTFRVIRLFQDFEVICMKCVCDCMWINFLSVSYLPFIDTDSEFALI